MEDLEIKEIEKKKRSLKRYKKNRALVNRLEEKLNLLDNRITSLRSPKLSDMPRGGTLITTEDLVSDKIDWTPYKGFVYTFDETKDIAWLYLVSDMLITDYSSVMFDYSILNRPMLFFAYDLEDYKENLRGFYFDFVNDIPGPISRDTDQLIKDIKEYNEDSWKEKYKNYHDKFNGIDDGHASQKVIDVIKKVSR